MDPLDSLNFDEEFDRLFPTVREVSNTSVSSEADIGRLEFWHDSTRVVISLTDEAWDAKRDVVKQLYVNENRDLKTLMQFMLVEHGFNAT
jgi:hypothetical protein